MLATRKLSKRFGEFSALSDVSIEFAPGLIHAVLGENGAGKSTLMKLLFGLHQPTSGEIIFAEKSVRFLTAADAIAAGLGMVQQHFSLIESLSVIDNIILGAEPMLRGGRLNRVRAITELRARLPSGALALDWYAPVESLSVGEKQKVEILKLLFRESQILFLDEPTAVLTPQETEEFFGILRELKKQGRTIVLITHKMTEVLQVCDTYSVLRHGALVAQGRVGDVDADHLIEAMIGRKIPSFAIEPISSRDETPALQVQDLASLKPANRGCLRGVSFTVQRNEIVGIAGVEGSGQSELVFSVMGQRRHRGTISIDGRVSGAGARQAGVGLIPEDRLLQGLWPEESCFVNMAIGLEDRFFRHGLLQREKLRTETTTWAEGFDVRASSLDQAVGSLSGGNQQKLIFARETTGRSPKLLLCHQPTRGVDLGAIDIIHRRLVEMRRQQTGILLISSELDELLKLSDRILVLFEGRIAAEFARKWFDRMKIGQAMTGGVANAH